MEVEVREEVASQDNTDAPLVNQTSLNSISEGPVIIVRAEEVLLVVLVLILWVAAIALFFNRWGKIRMLEPYQPKFQQNHRPSCPLVPLSPPPHVSAQQRMSFSKYNVNCFGDYSGLPSPNISRRPRLNSVFVGSTSMAYVNPPRRAKSAMDIQHMVLNEKSPTYSSMLPMINYKDRKPSITIERPHVYTKHRPSVSPDKPLLMTRYQHARNRRSSCLDQSDRLKTTDHRKTSLAPDQRWSTERWSSTKQFVPVFVPHQGPTISFEDTDGLKVGKVHRPKYSRSFEQPHTNEKTNPLPRMAASLEANATFATVADRRLSIPEEEVESRRHSQVVITFDEADVSANAPLLERLKSSDV